VGISLNKFNTGLLNKYTHNTSQRQQTNNLIYCKTSKIPQAPQMDMKQSLNKCLKLGIEKDSTH